MKHLILLMVCFLSFEIFIRTNYINLIISIINVSKKAIYIISNKNVSDHWKENILPKYSLMMIRDSLQMLLILFMIVSLFVIADKLFSGFLTFTLSWNGIIESILIAFSYPYIRKIFLNE